MSKYFSQCAIPRLEDDTCPVFAPIAFTTKNGEPCCRSRPTPGVSQLSKQTGMRESQAKDVINTSSFDELKRLAKGLEAEAKTLLQKQREFEKAKNKEAEKVKKQYQKKVKEIESLQRQGLELSFKLGKLQEIDKENLSITDKKRLQQNIDMITKKLEIIQNDIDRDYEQISLLKAAIPEPSSATAAATAAAPNLTATAFPSASSSSAAYSAPQPLYQKNIDVAVKTKDDKDVKSKSGTVTDEEQTRLLLFDDMYKVAMSTGNLKYIQKTVDILKQNPKLFALREAEVLQLLDKVTK